MTATIVLGWEKPLAFSGGTIYDYISFRRLTGCSCLKIIDVYFVMRQWWFGVLAILGAAAKE